MLFIWWFVPSKLDDWHSIQIIWKFFNENNNFCLSVCGKLNRAMNDNWPLMANNFILFDFNFKKCVCFFFFFFPNQQIIIRLVWELLFDCSNLDGRIQCDANQRPNSYIALYWKKNSRITNTGYMLWIRRLTVTVLINDWCKREKLWRNFGAIPIIWMSAIKSKIIAIECKKRHYF